ncbi:MAG: YidC/Oxa1 family membrane protein insertase [Patescibacteria group bacterium]
MWQEILYRPIYNALILIYDFLPYKDLGLAIIVLTILIRFILLPFSWSAVKSQRIMQSLNPELEKIKAQYKGDQQNLSKATMEFYKKHKINPFSSCLPLLIQLPILIALYQVLKNNIDHTQYELLYSFVPRPDSINKIFLGFIDLSQAFYPLAIVTGIAQFFQGYLLKPPATKKVIKNDRPKDEVFNAEDISSAMNTQFIYIMPLMTVFISWNLFAALPLYWVTTTLFSIVSQLVIIKMYPQKAIIAADEQFHTHPTSEVLEVKPEIIESFQEKDVNIQVKRRQN